MTTSDWLTARAYASPDKLALIIMDKQWTYRQLDGLVNQMASYLTGKGVRPGDFVAVLLPNSLEYVCLVHALARLGAVLVPLNTRLTAAELQWQIEYAGCKLVLYAAETENKWLTVNSQRLMINDDWHNEQSISIYHLPFTINHLQAVVFTSGTSGRPKGAMLTFANHFWSATASSYRLGIDPADRWLSVLPLYHVGGLAVIFRSCLYGTAVVLHHGFHLNSINHSLDTQQITLISLVPTMLYRLLQSRTHWPDSLRLILLGGAAATPERIQQANHLPRIVSGKPLPSNLLSITDHSLPLVAPTYGLTEAASQVATLLPEDAIRKPGCVGKPLMFTSVKIVDDQGNKLPSGEVGEIVVSGPTVMAGYFGDREATQSPIADLQSLNTGDMGYLDTDGDLWLVQRRSDLIISGGENVYPAEVEAVLRGHTAVSQVCVVGIPHPEWGQQVAAMVQLKPGQSVTEGDLFAFCRERLAGYKQPRHIQFVDKLPQTASGKIARREVVGLMRDT